MMTQVKQVREVAFGMNDIHYEGLEQLREDSYIHSGYSTGGWKYVSGDSVNGHTDFPVTLYCWDRAGNESERINLATSSAFTVKELKDADSSVKERLGFGDIIVGRSSLTRKYRSYELNKIYYLSGTKGEMGDVSKLPVAAPGYYRCKQTYNLPSGTYPRWWKRYNRGL